MQKTVISDAYRGELYLARTAREQNGALSGIRTISLSTLLEEESDSREAVLLQLRRMFCSCRKEYPVYGDMFSYAAFFAEILSFAENCLLYGIKAEDLPAGDAREEELRRILQKVLQMDLAAARNAEKIPARLAEAEKLQNACLIPSFFTDCWHARLQDRLGLCLPVYKPSSSHAEKLLFSADNPCRELEAIAQDIIRRRVPSNVILADPSSQLPVLKEVFARYRIPYSLTAESMPSLIYIRFAALAEAAVRQDGEHLFACLRCNAFPVPFPKDLLSFAEETLSSVRPDGSIHVLLAGCAAFKDRAAETETAEKRINEWFASCADELSALFGASSSREILSAAYEIIRKNPLLKDPEALKEGLALRGTLAGCLDSIESTDDLLYFLQMLKTHSVSRHQTVSSFCTVTDLRHPVDPAPVSYVAGCSGTAYPGFTAESGLFDEQYTARIPGYPSLMERHDLYMKNMKWVEESAAQTLIYSCPGSDLQGREIQIAYELEEMFGKGKAVPWPLALPPYRPGSIHRLSPESAAALFLEDGRITGSVSTIERWFSCPYAWFLQSGLKLYVSSMPDADAAGIGTIQHAVLEAAVRTLHKQYGEMKEEDVSALIRPCFDALRAMHPRRSALLDLTEKRMLQSLMKSLAYLADYEKHTSFQPAEAEYRFLAPITEHVTLRGTIDRVDFFDGAFRIIDYKSSEHSLSPSAISSGTQLQLLSYLIIAAGLFDKIPYGAYYFSLKEPSISLPAAGLSGRGKNREVVRSLLTKEDLENAVRKARMLRGTTYTDHKDAVDDSGNYVSMPSGEHRYETACSVIHTLYEYFYTEIEQGNIELAPLEGACTFCDFRTICRHHGDFRSRPKITDAKGV